ncbi:MADS-box transcription factor rlmA [Ziziphus jujuba]|uniref:MADS-box transcription factor rlmA n=1 Tax=Ziziphus jujuba TaxID=326968 RepID=A0A6P4BA72_ZIZJJ|nr:MADS-box transcription factor rlmA [Ziziphus jujuba]
MRPMGKGKRKVAMELIKDKQSRMVSFSKRRHGLMKKAEEFHSISGSSIALIVLSQAGRPFVYGAPCFDSVIHRFLQHQINFNNHNHNNTNNNNNELLLLTHSHPDPSLSLPHETLLMGLGRQGQGQGQGSNQEHHNAAVYGTHAQSCTTTTIPPDPTAPDNNNVVAHVADQIQEPPWPAAFLPDPTSEFLIAQGSTFTTDSDDQEENAHFDLIDVAPWLAASPDHSFYAPLPPHDQVVDHSFDVPPPPPPPPPQILIGQGSTTDYSHQEYDDYLLDTAPWLAAAMPDHPFHAPPEVVSFRVSNTTTPEKPRGGHGTMPPHLL